MKNVSLEMDEIARSKAFGDLSAEEKVLVMDLLGDESAYYEFRTMVIAIDQSIKSSEVLTPQDATKEMLLEQFRNKNKITIPITQNASTNRPFYLQTWFRIAAAVIIIMSISIFVVNHLYNPKLPDLTAMTQPKTTVPNDSNTQNSAEKVVTTAEQNTQNKAAGVAEDDLLKQETRNTETTTGSGNTGTHVEDDPVPESTILANGGLDDENSNFFTTTTNIDDIAADNFLEKDRISDAEAVDKTIAYNDEPSAPENNVSLTSVMDATTVDSEDRAVGGSYDLPVTGTNLAENPDLVDLLFSSL